ncbi:MAG: glycosyltransferase family 4 protein [Acidimicrobiaceae bacterium]|nr:glycosyltransferase family 4 protein [Acidimicrobiaceae bacterium]
MGQPLMRVAYLVPRYGLEVIGGAEHATRRLAENLVDGGWSVEVFTTTALESTTWAHSYPEGTTAVNGVTVHRFRSGERAPDFDTMSQRVLAAPALVSAPDAELWIDLQGPACPEALHAAAACDADLVILYPYLYWPSVHGVRAFGTRTVLHPAAHDEPPIYLPLFRDVFANTGGLVFQDLAERQVTERVLPQVAGVPQALIGLGVDPQSGPPGASAELGVGENPFVLCLGRVDELKGTTFLAEWFAAYKARRPGPTKLVFAGPVHNPPPAHPDIILAGPVTEPVKWAALRDAAALISPSAHEAFSLVLLEAWSVGTPVLVNGRGAVTAGHCRRSGGGLSFTSYGSFEVELDRILSDENLRGRLGDAGQAYVNEFFTWGVLIPRYQAFLRAVAARHQEKMGQPKTEASDGYDRTA